MWDTLYYMGDIWVCLFLLLFLSPKGRYKLTNFINKLPLLQLSKYRGLVNKSKKVYIDWNIFRAGLSSMYPGCDIVVTGDCWEHSCVRSVMWAGSAQSLQLHSHTVTLSHSHMVTFTALLTAQVALHRFSWLICGLNHPMAKNCSEQNFTTIL